MLNIEIGKEKMESQKEEFRRLLVWIVEHHDEWECICNMAAFEPPVEKQLELLEVIEKNMAGTKNY